MYLKALELQGFKSFADKTVLNFDGDITAIVGPNGSGKSNISDAIRWVLGEQSTRQLRGAKMEDIIFGGTQKRAQVGFAEASIVLDNSDSALSYDAPEVMITRRYFRSGESEYFINKQQARLRDILEIFMDTGLGNSGYSNIGQGHIDEILSLKSTDRREIFEEAAGISKYRHRKEETERKLESTDDNLLRIGDKISELELQLTPLKQQADKAQQFLTLKSELKSLEITAWMQELDNISTDKAKTEADLKSAEFILGQQHESLDKLYKEIESITAQVQEYDTKLNDQRDALSQLNSKIQQHESSHSLILSEISNHRENISRIQSDIGAQQGRIDQLQTQIDASEKRITEIDAEDLQYEEEYKNLDAKAQELASLGEKNSSDFIRMEKELTDLQASLSHSEKDVKDLEAFVSESDERLEQLLEENHQALRKKNECLQLQGEYKKALREAEENITASKNSIAGYKLRLDSFTGRIEILRKNCNELQVNFNTAEKNLSMLRNMERDFEGFSKSVRAVMQEAQRGTLRNIIGPVSSVIHVSEDCALAIETALGYAQQDIIVESDNDGKAAMMFLKRRNLGRATFQPLQVIRGGLLYEKGLADCSGFVGIASELAQYDAKYQDVIRHLLGRTVIVEDIDSALRIAKQYSRRFRIVSLDGQVINAGGSMTGGSAASGTGFISRRNDIERLTIEIEDNNKKLTEQEQELRQLEQKSENCRYQQSILEGELRVAEDSRLRTESNIAGSEQLLEVLDQTLSSQENELSSLNDAKKQASEHLSELRQQCEKLTAEIEKLEEVRDELKSRNTDSDRVLSELSDKLNRIRSGRSSLQAEKEASRRSISSFEQLLNGLKNETADKVDNISSIMAEIEEMKLRAEAEEKNADDLRTRYGNDSLALNVTLKERNDLEERKTIATREMTDKNKDILAMDAESNRLKQKKQLSEQNEKQLIDRLWDSYNLTHSTAQQFVIEIESFSAAQRRISELKRKIGALGNPNLGAIEEYNRIHERWEYLDGQKQDVEKAKQELTGILRSITKEMTSIFTSEFAKINTYFSQTFVEMFGGGKGELILEDPDSPLDCGIEIKVQPPGKQLKTITLLSGGEKAFVAIALYFAILKVRPTPFCMLDEIDAALDETNVHRFASYLRNLSQSTQFIVITHRRGTMEEADTLYGVTMQEQGVSKMLHLNLNEISDQLGIES